MTALVDREGFGGWKKRRDPRPHRLPLSQRLKEAVARETEKRRDVKVGLAPVRWMGDAGRHGN